MRDFAALEARRLKAARLFARGCPQAQVARALGVSPMSVCRWHRVWLSGGTQALRRQAPPGPRPRLSERQRRQLLKQLLKGPQAHGHATQLWTLARIARLIQKLFGVRYHPGHIWYVLRRLGWTTHRPGWRARERDEAAIARWREEDWPRIKRGR